MMNHGIFNANPGVCRTKLDGNAAIGKEITLFVQADYIVCPTNNGSLLRGVWMGARTELPGVKMVAAVSEQTDVASSIKGFSALDNPLEVVASSGGAVVAVSDQEIVEGCKDLFREGIIAEPASAASIASIRKLEDRAGKVVCCVVSGHGMKYPVQGIYRPSTK